MLTFLHVDVAEDAPELSEDQVFQSRQAVLNVCSALLDDFRTTVQPTIRQTRQPRILRTVDMNDVDIAFAQASPHRPQISLKRCWSKATLKMAFRKNRNACLACPKFHLASWRRGYR